MGDNAYKQKHKEQGLCRDCSRLALPKRVLCIIHSINNSARIKAWLQLKNNHEKVLKANYELKKRYRATNRCPACSAPLGEQDEGYVRCVNCRDSSFMAIPRYSPISGGLLENYYKEVTKQS